MNIKSEITSGLRCKTYVIEEDGKNIIYQEYKDNAYYQAKKKYEILNKIANIGGSEYIPKCYKYFNLEDKSVLYTEYRSGHSLHEIRKNRLNFKFDKIAEQLSKVLYKIHSIKDNECFGWITDCGCIEKKNLEEYVKSEFERFQGTFKEKLSYKDLEFIESKEEVVLNFLKKKNNLKPQLIWYDLNPENILINEKNELACIVDPGGAKYGIKEIDLAFLRMEVCENEYEYQSLLTEYKKLDKTVDEGLIEVMGILVELDDIMLRIQDGIDIPIPYCSNFKDLITRI